jgi:hypothetical protein
MLSFAILSVAMLNVVMQNVVAPFLHTFQNGAKYSFQCCDFLPKKQRIKRKICKKIVLQQNVKH